MTHFLALFVAGCFEVVGVVVMNRYAHAPNFKQKAKFGLLSALTFGCSLILLWYAMHKIEMSVAYAVWTGIGAVGAVMLGVVLYKENLKFRQYFYLFLIIISAVMLKIV